MPPGHPRCPVVLKDESEAQGSKGVAAESNIKAIPKVPTSSWFWSPTHKTRKKTPLQAADKSYLVIFHLTSVIIVLVLKSAYSFIVLISLSSLCCLPDYG
ncbi:hypothetical protein MJO28_016579 [Puccinia striiformis f. sp. tritici]|uniref:Uncharacterized protein n=1 Tax=Puccinia striiformis f. sp. tritici TaxID=168172 RepID=A0ACC0DPZ0_9BASI|nr:hypothetical protein Pst134EA_030335 [Puccinia striiformis f. sp. tritici]KAH9440256.1 hypothetical protein Pst134EB_030878 [Puccinia striiformis f. sp. tritici]KAH9446416.1 hypothetical protein Pst134EA_030335 [Puccinia striiformis f. sp. tritici]KAI7935708.1 hypothetical protein MJO28_016579 [Puccinia striiformis f. sp. tritici]